MAESARIARIIRASASWTISADPPITHPSSESTSSIDAFNSRRYPTTAPTQSPARNRSPTRRYRSSTSPDTGESSSSSHHSFRPRRCRHRCSFASSNDAGNPAMNASISSSKSSDTTTAAFSNIVKNAGRSDGARRAAAAMQRGDHTVGTEKGQSLVKLHQETGQAGRGRKVHSQVGLSPIGPHHGRNGGRSRHFGSRGTRSSSPPSPFQRRPY